MCTTYVLVVLQIMLPQVLTDLEAAVHTRDLLRLKADIYALCNAFVVHPARWEL